MHLRSTTKLTEAQTIFQHNFRQRMLCSQIHTLVNLPASTLDPTPLLVLAPKANPACTQRPKVDYNPNPLLQMFLESICSIIFHQTLLKQMTLWFTFQIRMVTGGTCLPPWVWREVMQSRWRSPSLGPGSGLVSWDEGCCRYPTLLGWSGSWCDSRNMTRLEKLHKFKSIDVN